MINRKTKHLFTVVLVCISMSICLSSCSVTDKYFDNIRNKKDAESKAEKVVEYINNRDIEKLAKLFTVHDQENDDLESDLRSLINYIDGEIESYEFNYDERSTSVRDGKLTYQLVIITLEKVKTDQEKNYILDFEECIVNEEENLIGIENLSIRDENWKEIYTVYCD